MSMIGETLPGRVRRREGGMTSAPASMSAGVLTPAAVRALAGLSSLLLAAVLVAVLALSWDDIGVPGEALAGLARGEALLAFHASGFDAQRLPASSAPGALFDYVAVVLQRGLSLAGADAWRLASAIAALAAMLAAWRLAALLGGQRAALLALVMLALSGLWSGSMLSGGHDVALAACLTWAVLLVTRLLSAWPQPSRGDAVYLGVALGGALAMRPEALWLVLALLAPLLLQLSRARGGASGIALAVLTASLMYWLFRPGLPGSAAALALPLEASGGPTRSGLFAYLFVKLPELMLIGLALALAGRLWRSTPQPPAAERRRVGRERRMLHGPLLLAILVPPAMHWLAADRAGGEMGVALAMMPSLAVGAALGWRMFWQSLHGMPVARAAMATMFALLSGVHLGALLHLHPYTPLYFNQLSGGLRAGVSLWPIGAATSATRELAGALEAAVARQPDVVEKGSALQVAICGDAHASTILSPPLSLTTDWRKADFWLVLGGAGCPSTDGGHTLHRVMREGVVLGALVERRAVALSDRLR